MSMLFHLDFMSIEYKLNVCDLHLNALSAEYKQNAFQFHPLVLDHVQPFYLHIIQISMIQLY